MLSTSGGNRGPWLASGYSLMMMMNGFSANEVPSAIISFSNLYESERVLIAHLAIATDTENCDGI